MTTTLRRPRMPVSDDTRFWLEGAAAGELRIERCADCGTLRHPPRPMCPSCHSLHRDHAVAGGRGTVYSYAVYHHQPASGLPVPYTVVVVDLEEGTRVIGNLLGDGPVDVGDAVEVVFAADEGDDMVLPHWRRIGAEA